jgi:hypothetical protein
VPVGRAEQRDVDVVDPAVQGEPRPQVRVEQDARRERQDYPQRRPDQLGPRAAEHLEAGLVHGANDAPVVE